MATLEQITKGAYVKGIIAGGAVSVIDTQWHGSDVLEVFYQDPAGRPDSQLLYRDSEPDLEVLQPAARWSFTGSGADFRLAMEAERIRQAHHFDPFLAVHTSDVIPLPHQITAVYQEMLPRQPLRFLLADDPGSGKTIMTGLYIKELMVRGDLQRCLIVSPGVLAEQWQDELYHKFGLTFTIMPPDAQDAISGNWFIENPLAIARLDRLSRNERLQERLHACDWDLVVCDEAHKMSATMQGDEKRYTKRYRLGELLSQRARHFLLLTATPHNGKEADFQLFMALLDGDRFESIPKDGVHQADPSDLMRRMVKEDLVRFDQTPLFPERRAYTVTYTLSAEEAALYTDVTHYVREQFNLADKLPGQGRTNVGFALTSLQRRLASSPEAIYQSLRRRRERLEKRLREEQLLRRGEHARLELASFKGLLADDDDPEAIEELIEAEDETPQPIDEASAAQTISDLQREIALLKTLERAALSLRRSGRDRKWDELSHLLQEHQEMRSPTGARRKLVIFTEHRDTLNYLQERITGVLGRSEAVVVIHGAIGREERRSAQERFTYDPDALVLVATDAAGEGINLQCAHLMVNYDLPWNPNRLEQRFGRIHRIGQQEVCHLWNLVANETREGDVYKRLLDKLEEERLALGGQVFDILGRLVFDNEPLRNLLLQAVRYGDDPQVQQRLFQKVEHALNTEKIRELIYGGALVREAMDGATVQRVREEMERAEVRRLQPHYVESFFLRAFRELGGSVHQREPRRYEITHVPQAICRRDRETGRGAIVQKRYERVTFEREQVSRQGLPTAAYLCPGHPLLDATISLTMEQRCEVLRRGAMLVDPLDPGISTRALIALEHTITDGRTRTDGNPCVVSQRFLFVELDEQGNALDAGSAPYLDYRPLTEEEQTLLESAQPAAWMHGDLERRAIGFAAQTLVPQHYQEVRRQREDWVDRARKAVHERLTRAINYWDNRAEDLRLREDAADQPHTASERARRRRDELIERLKTRMEELERERQLHRPVPRVVAGALIVPIGLLNRLRAGDIPLPTQAIDTRRSEQLAMQAVMERERALGYEPVDVSAQKRGYDIESRRPDGSLRFIEVKGRAPGADTLTVTRNEVLTALNRPQDWWLALVEIDGDSVGTPRYIRAPFSREPEFFMTTQQCKIAELLRHAEPPA